MKSISLITITILALLTHILVAQQHCNNLLLDFFHFQPLSSPQPGTDLPYCHHLKSALTCCSVETVTSFQQRADRILDKINNYNAARDLYLAQLRFRYYERFIQLLNNITENHKGDLKEIRSINATFADQLEADIVSFKLARDGAQDIHNEFLKALYEYQQARTKCLTTALQIRSSAWCMACDPNYQNEGLNDDGSVSFSDSLCQTISNDCWDYFDRGAKFNGLFKVREVYWKLLKVAEYLDNYPYGNATKLNDPDPYKPISTQHIVTVPDRWTSADGNCGDFWSRDSQLSKILAFGTVTSGAEQASAGIVSEEEANIALIEPRGRMLYGLFHLIEDLTDPDVNWYVYPDPGDYYGIADFSDLGDLLTFGLGDLFD